MYFISERGESGYRAGGIRMWSVGDIEKATSTLERVFHQMGKWDDRQEQDTILARKALVSIVDGFKEDVIRWLQGIH